MDLDVEKKILLQMPPTSPPEGAVGHVDTTNTERSLARLLARYGEPKNEPFDLKPVTESQAPEALETLIQQCQSPNLELDIHRVARWAVMRSHIYGLDVLKYLIEKKKANLFKGDITGRPAIFYGLKSLDAIDYIASQCRTGNVSRLLSCQDKDGWTPLHHAVEGWYYDAVERLLALDVDMNIKNNGGRVAIDMDPYGGKLIKVIFAFRKLETAERSEASWLTETTQNHRMSSPYFDLYQLSTGIWGNGLKFGISGEKGCILVLAAMRWLERYATTYQHSMPGFFLRFMNTALIASGDPCLLHLAPSYHIVPKLTSDADAPFSAIIIFPYFVLRSQQEFDKMREETNNLKSIVADGICEKYIHHELTLDETYYPSLSAKALASRNGSQVVSRESAVLEGNETDIQDRPILTVPQIWIWESGNHIISCCPRDYSHEDSDNRLWNNSPGVGVGCSLVEKISKFGSKREDGRFRPPLDYFEAGVVRVLEDVRGYIDDKAMSHPDMEKEHEYMFRIADIREELAMIRHVLNSQLHILNTFIREFERRYSDSPPFLDRGDPDDSKRLERKDIDRKWEEVKGSRDIIDNYQKRINKIDSDAERIEKSIQDQLNLNRTYASIKDAQDSLIATRVSLVISTAVIGFTVITIIFAPLAFVAALFTLPIEGLLKNQVQSSNGAGKDGNQEGTSAYTTTYVGTWFAVAELVTLIVTVGLALLSHQIIKSTTAHQGPQNGQEQQPLHEKVTRYRQIFWQAAHATKNITDRRTLSNIPERRVLCERAGNYFRNLLQRFPNRVNAEASQYPERPVELTSVSAREGRDVEQGSAAVMA
ncbi:hypothetical protein NPX13_g5573 [Xylaria arbuscula]|uniref:Ankyrin repeat protein n=1 Tax=Xylaria arbuscula TaxID=114810 RepID=A0A9W8NE69_9PEZI|nr:hypothetical protein NPX13_g5573 [Xylaria arbuscula]